MYRRDICTGEKLAAGECKDAKGQVLVALVPDTPLSGRGIY